MTIHVVHLIGSLERAGAEMVALDLVKALPADEVAQTFICLSGRRGSLAEEFEGYGARVTAPYGGRILRFLAALREMRKLAPDVVQSHVLLTGAWFLLFARAIGTKRRIARLHSSGDGHADTWIRIAYRALCRRALRCGATSVLAVSGPALEFAGLTPSRSGAALEARMVPNGVDTERFHFVPGALSHPTMFLHVGRNNPAKNRVLLPPIYEALRRRAECSLRVVGSDDHSDMGGDLAGITLEGERDDMPHLYSSSAALVLPSRREGLPGVVLESLASGTPAVVSDIPTLRALAEQVPGITLVPLDAAPEEWATSLWLAAGLGHRERREIATALARSEFALREQCCEWKKIWQGKR